MKKFILIFFLLFAFGCIRYDGAKKHIKPNKYKGVIEEIYRDDRNHGMWTFTVNTTDNESINIVANSWSRSWEYAEIGDSIIKPADTLMIIIKKNDSTYKEFFYKF